MTTINRPYLLLGARRLSQLHPTVLEKYIDGWVGRRICIKKIQLVAECVETILISQSSAGLHCDVVCMYQLYTFFWEMFGNYLEYYTLRPYRNDTFISCTIPFCNDGKSQVHKHFFIVLWVEKNKKLYKSLQDCFFSSRWWPLQPMQELLIHSI